MKIAKIKGREILDSRGNPTVEVDDIRIRYHGTCICSVGCIHR